MISSILPPGVAGVESTGGAGEGLLLPEEEAVLGRAVPARRREFAIGRVCARAALAQLGASVAPILRGARREPVWPPGIVGSITHCGGYCAVVVARSEDFSALGLDAEPNEPLPGGVFEMIATPEERAALQPAFSADVCRDRLLFSAKESVYKAWFPLTGRWLGFEEVVLTLEPQMLSFRARLVAGEPRADADLVASLRGRYLLEDRRILTLVTRAPA